MLIQTIKDRHPLGRSFPSTLLWSDLCFPKIVLVISLDQVIRQGIFYRSTLSDSHHLVLVVGSWSSQKVYVFRKSLHYIIKIPSRPAFTFWNHLCTSRIINVDPGNLKLTSSHLFFSTLENYIITIMDNKNTNLAWNSLCFPIVSIASFCAN